MRSYRVADAVDCEDLPEHAFIRETLDVIEQVLDSVTISRRYRIVLEGIRDAWGDLDGRTDHIEALIRINPSAAHKHLTLAHEVAHVLDDQHAVVLGLEHNPQIYPLFWAVQDSDRFAEYQHLKTWFSVDSVRYAKELEFIAQYLESAPEIWARACAQYIAAMHHEGSGVAADLEGSLGLDPLSHIPQQWHPSDFQLIASEVDTALQGVGLDNMGRALSRKHKGGKARVLQELGACADYPNACVSASPGPLRLPRLTPSQLAIVGSLNGEYWHGDVSGYDRAERERRGFHTSIWDLPRRPPAGHDR